MCYILIIMARPERRNVDYFPHYLSEGKKMYLIEHKYGNDGYAVWFKVLETLATTDDHWLNLNDETNVMFMSAKCRVKEEVLFSILDDLSKLEEISSVLWKDKIVWSEKFVESIQDAYSRRNNKCMNLHSLCQHLLSLGIHKPSNCKLKGNNKPQSKVNNNKLEESIEERQSKFAETLKPYVDKYGRDFIKDFYLHWSEPTTDNKQLRYELEKTWGLGKRLGTWSKNAIKFGTTLPKEESQKFRAAWQ
jgi:hypothetical protein